MNQTTQRKGRKSNNLPSPIPAYEGKLPPQAPEIEESVIGALMIEKDAYSKVCELLKPETFYDNRLGKIYAAISSLAIHEKPIDMFTVIEQLKKDETLEEIGGEYTISLLTSKVSSAAHIEFHARIVAQKYLSRELIRLASDIQQEAFDDKTDVDDLLQEAEGKLFSISQQNTKKEAQAIGSILKEAIDRINIASNRGDGLSGLPSFYTEIDKITSGWQPSDLIIIAARPAMGKTAFVLSMAKQIAVDNNFPVALFSLEMSNVQLVNRIISNVCRIPGEKIRNGKLEREEWNALDLGLKKMEDAPLYLDDTPGLSIFELRTKARRLVREKDIKLIIIDYLQLMNASGMNFGSREQEVSMISRSLKGLAKELNIPIIALSQLNRGVENRGKENSADSRRPQLSDLRESGAIEQDADMVCFIHRPEYYKIYEGPNGEDYTGMGQIIIAKHRNGAVGDVLLRFQKDYASFENDNLYREHDSLMNRSSFYTQKNTESTPTTSSSDLPTADDSGMPF